MDDIRALEEETKRKLDEDREKGEIKGTSALEKQQENCRYNVISDQAYKNFGIILNEIVREILV